MLDDARDFRALLLGRQAVRGSIVGLGDAMRIAFRRPRVDRLAVDDAPITLTAFAR